MSLCLSGGTKLPQIHEITKGHKKNIKIRKNIMKINKFLRLLILFLFLTTANNLAQNKINTSYEYSNHNIFIYYDFTGDASKEYDVSILLKRTSQPDFLLKPGSLTGDLGKGKFANEKRKITWHLTPQEESSLTADDYYFEVTANEIKSGGGLPWYVYVGGVVLGGGAAAFLLLNKKSESTGTGSETSFPNPPVRP